MKLVLYTQHALYVLSDFKVSAGEAHLHIAAVPDVRSELCPHTICRYFC